VSGAAVDPALACDDGDACTVETCAQGAGCQHTPRPATAAESVTCGVENLEDILARAPSPACTDTCIARLDRRFARIRALVAAATDAPSHRCRRKLDRALAAAARLRRRVAATSNLFTPPDRALQLETEALRLAGRIAARRDSCPGG
jgi:hypothetical protein